MAIREQNKAVTGEELDKAKEEMNYYRHIGGFGYKQAKRHYERLVRRARCRG